MNENNTSPFFADMYGKLQWSHQQSCRQLVTWISWVVYITFPVLKVLLIKVKRFNYQFFYFLLFHISFYTSTDIIFRWGTYLYVSLFLSAHPSVVHHIYISGTMHHVIIIFGNQFFHFLKFSFLVLLGG